MIGTHRFGIGGLVALAGMVVLALGSSSVAGAANPAGAAADSPVQTTADREIATLEAVTGRVSIIRLGQPQPASPSMPLLFDDIVVTRRGRATVRFHSDSAVIRIGPDSRVQINESARERDIKLFFGRLWAHVVRWKERPTRFATSSTIAAIRGTELSLGVEVDGDETRLSVLEGRVEAQTDVGSLTLEGGQTAVGRKGSAPTLSIRVRPQDAVQWALYYLPVLYANPGELAEGDWQGTLRQALVASLGGDLAGAFDGLDSVADGGIRDPRFFTYRASLLLATGSVEGAGEDLERALELAPNDSNALALQTIIAVVNNRTDQALATANRAVVANPKSATAHLARSYARQARFDLDGARESVENAVRFEPDDALAWARLAEIRSSLGYRHEALEAARKASALEPNLSRTQTVLGYAHLTSVDTRAAREVFARAIELDQDDPLPRLGLGLALIRDGDLAGGSREIEIAVSLDPGQALVRSYLGKAYFEAKRAALEEREYDVAKQADPLDPTPWLYDAIAKQTTNQPVEALRSLQKAIELNDNRAVYRSRLLLDSDLAARSASLGRLFADLGFQNVALVEGWNSVNTDPGNHSAHRLLADSYAALPRHEVARVSELLQSQLLQPLNTTPIQPRLGESNLFLISAGGPASLSFNEFNPLFSRDGVSLQVAGLAGQDGLWSGEGILAGIYRRLSFSAGYNQFETDGWRTNANQKDQIGNAFVQLEVSPRTSLQAEYRYRDRERGDLQQRFAADAFLPGVSDTEQRHTVRLGGRHAFSPASSVLASLTYQDSDLLARTDDLELPDTYIATMAPRKAYGAELQHLYRSPYIDLTSGAGFFKIDGEIRSELSFFGMVEQTPTIETKFDHLNLYGYANVKPLTTVVLTLGGSFERLEGDLPGGGRDQFNPKLGLTWNPTPSTSFRAAAFRTLKRTLITDQTIEPTQVAGLNQFFDDSDTARAWRYGTALDQQLGRDAYAGAEFSRRDLAVPFIDLESLTQEATWDETLFRGYLFATPHRSVALRAQYVLERFARDEKLTLGFSELKTHRIPLGMSFFHRSGLVASLSATYWKQDGQFEDLFAFEPTFEPGRSSFWLVDATLSFRLPKRYGFLSIGATNLFDEDFEYFEVDFDNPTIQPTRTIFARVTLAVP